MSKTWIFSVVAGAALVAMSGVLSAIGGGTAHARETSLRNAFAAAEAARSPDGERKRWDNSGTMGRMDLGADPYHPEGPGSLAH